MGKKQDQPIFPLWSAIIGVVGIILGAAIGYFGTQASAQAQIETAKINIYGPIYATQTAKAEFALVTPVVTQTAPEDFFLETVSQEIYSFQGSDEQGAGKANLRILYALSQPPTYVLIYDLPTSTEEYGSAGLAFNFAGGINVSEYKSLDFTTQFDSANQSIDLYLIDRVNRKSVSIVSPGKDAINVSFPLINFTGMT